MASDAVPLARAAATASIQTGGKGGLGKSQLGIDTYGTGARRADFRRHLPVHTARQQLLAIAFQIVKPADLVARAFGLAHGIGHGVCRRLTGAMCDQRRARRLFDLIQRNLCHMLCFLPV